MSRKIDLVKVYSIASNDEATASLVILSRKIPYKTNTEKYIIKIKPALKRAELRALSRACLKLLRFAVNNADRAVT